MPKLVSAILAKNEANRYLERVIHRCIEFSDSVLLLDDRSSDDTPKLAERLGCKVKGRSVLKGDAWGNEAPARAELWDWASEEAGDGWVLVNDGDMILRGDPRSLCWTWAGNAWCFVLADMWSETHFRTDGFWQAHLNARPWLVRPKSVPDDWKAEWNQRGLHCGHIPANFPLRALIAPPDTYFWEHWAYARSEDRRRKMHDYLQNERLLTKFEADHARSIGDGLENERTAAAEATHGGISRAI